MSAIDPMELRGALGRFMTGVTVVTTIGPDGEPIGFTANSFTSVSLDPPLLLVCPGRHLSSFDVFAHVETFSVNVLADAQEAVSNLFAKPGTDRFASVAWSPDVHGVPVLNDVCAWFSCRVHQRHDAGDHLILVGEIVDFDHRPQEGLGYSNGAYFTLQREQRSDAGRRDALTEVAGLLLEHDGHLLTVPDTNGYRLPRLTLAEGDGARSALRAHLVDRGLAVALGPVYSVYTTDVDDAHHARVTFFRARSDTGDTGGIGRFVALDELTGDAMSDSAEATMVQRYREEREHREFGFYLGTRDAGEIHHATGTEGQ